MWLRQYLLGVTAAALICGIIKSLFPKKGTMGTVMKTLLGLAMVLAVVSPWASISMNNLHHWKDDQRR